MSQFTSDLEIGRRGELIALEAFTKLYPHCKFKDVARDKAYYYVGDIEVENTEKGTKAFIEVKNDSRIATTRNVLCEDEYFDKYNGEFYKGNMANVGTTFYCVVSEPERAIYILDYKELQKIYKQGEFKRIIHETQDTFAYLMPLSTLKRKGILLETINY